MKKEIKYTTDGKCSVYANGTEIARSYVGSNGFDVRILQGMAREETANKIIEDCPDFAAANNMMKTTRYKLFSH